PAWHWYAARSRACGAAGRPSGGWPDGRRRPVPHSGAAGCAAPTSARSWDPPPSAAPPAPATPSRPPGPFFERRPATPDLTDPRDGHVGQGAGQFGPAAPDGLLVHARDLRQQALATVPHPIR